MKVCKNEMVNIIRILFKFGGYIYLYECFGVVDYKSKFVGKIFFL